MKNSHDPGEEIEVSVIVPMEFHRDQALACIEGWARRQTYPRTRFQIVIAAPPTLDAAFVAELRAFLQPWDRLETYPFTHDMPLVAEAAKVARGEWLLFTESHCIPEPNALEHLLGVASANPEWAGLSGATQPITHNFLSEIEAELYDGDIREKLTCQSWLKVLDQCFLIRKAAYWESGGVEPEYGHFAEWLLAASLRRAGYQLGADLTPVIRHFYIGQLADLEEFTLDFARGEIKFMAECGDEDIRASYFQAIPELDACRERSKADYWVMSRLSWMAILKTLARGSRVRIASVWGAVGWIMKSMGGEKGGYLHVRISEFLARLRLKFAILRREKSVARSALLGWFDKLVVKGRMQYLAEHNKLDRQTRNPNFSASCRWTAEDELHAELLGFYGQESIQGRAFRWSQNVASAYLPLHQSSYRIVLEWDATRPIQARELLCVEFDGNRVPDKNLTVRATSLILEVNCDSRGWHQVSWTVTPFPAVGDGRLLGLPITRMRWFAIDPPAAHGGRQSAVGAMNTPLYFLHIHKCAGTTTRLLLDNAFCVETIFAAYSGSYYPEDLPDNPSLADPKQFYRGHFRMGLFQFLPESKWHTVTVLREPVDRLLSLFHYLQQHGRIAFTLDFMQWAETECRFQNLMTSHLTLDIDRLQNTRGDKAVRDLAMAKLDEALANLGLCQIVGLTEHLEDTINLFAWQLGFLPPLLTPRNNPTKDRLAVNQLSVETRSRLESLLEADIRLYQRAREMFQDAMNAMRQSMRVELGEDPETMDIRALLRQQFVRRLGDEGDLAPPPDNLAWWPDDVFLGENLHERERHGTISLRWTGPNKSTHFLMYMGPSRTWELQISLHPATPRHHVEQAKLRVNEVEVPLSLGQAPGGYVLSGVLAQNVAALSIHGVAQFELITPVARGESEFRMLGVAVEGMSLKLMEADQSH